MNYWTIMKKKAVKTKASFYNDTYEIARNK